MDPLSITAGVIAVIQAVNKTLSICLKFRTALKESPSGLTKTVNEVRNLRNIFEALQLGLDENTDTVTSPGVSVIHEKIRDSMGDILPQCQDILGDLDQHLGSPLEATSGPISARSRVSATARWYLIESHVKSCLDRLETCKSRLILALSVHQSALLLQMRATAISGYTMLEASNSRIEDKLDAMSALKSEAEEHDIIKWLSPINFRLSHLDIVSQHQAGTSNWVSACDEFKKWYQGDARLLWLNGAPGTGKSQLFAHLVEYIVADRSKDPEKSIVAYVYCDFREPESLEPSNILGSIVAQCCIDTTCIPLAIRTTFRTSQSAGHEGPPPLALLKESVSEILQRQRLFILIDGMDESKKAEQLGDIIHDICSEPLDLHARVLVTGRKTESLESILGGALQLQLHEHSQKIREDIRIYIMRHLEKNRRLQWLPLEIKQHISDVLAEDMNPMFRWVQCQLDAIAPLRSVKAIRQALTQLPTGLGATYSRIISSIPQFSQQTLRSALEWVSFSFTPLTLIELHEALAVEPGIFRLDPEARLLDPMDTLLLGNSLLNLSPTGYIHLSHLSVRDYLMSSEHGDDRSVDYFCFASQNSHQKLTLICLTYLMLDAFVDGPATTAGDFAERLQQYPFLKYAASAWPYHANSAFAYHSENPQSTETTAGHEELLELIMTFFRHQYRAHFMSWVQVLNATCNFKWDIYPRHATALYYSASFGLDVVVEKLMADPEFNPSDLNAPGSRYGGTPVHAAAYRQHALTLQILLKAGASAAKADFNGVTPMHSAAAIGDLDILHIILSQPCSDEMANAEDDIGETPYDWALRSSQTLAAQMLKPRTLLRLTLAQRLDSMPETQESQQEVGASPMDEHRSELEAEQAVSPRLGPISPNQPVGYFPDFYRRRSGMESSVILEIHGGVCE